MSVNLRPPCADEKLRHPRAIQIFLYCSVRRRSQRIKHEQHAVFLDEASRLLNGLRRTKRIVTRNEFDLPAVDAAVRIDHREIGGIGLAECTVGRRRPAVRHRIAELDFGVRGAGIVGFLRMYGPGHDAKRQKRRQKHKAHLHETPPFLSICGYTTHLVSLRMTEARRYSQRMRHCLPHASKAAVEERLRFLMRDDIEIVAPDGVHHQCSRPVPPAGCVPPANHSPCPHRPAAPPTRRVRRACCDGFRRFRRHPHRAEHGNANAIVTQIF